MTKIEGLGRPFCRLRLRWRYRSHVSTRAWVALVKMSPLLKYRLHKAACLKCFGVLGNTIGGSCPDTQTHSIFPMDGCSRVNRNSLPLAIGKAIRLGFSSPAKRWHLLPGYADLQLKMNVLNLRDLAYRLHENRKLLYVSQRTSPFNGQIGRAISEKKTT